MKMKDVKVLHWIFHDSSLLHVIESPTYIILFSSLIAISSDGLLCMTPNH